MPHKYKAYILNALYLFVSCVHTYSSWLYKCTPEFQLLLQSIMKIIFVAILCKMKTKSMPKIVIYDKYLLLSAVVYGLSSLCTSYLWLSVEITPYMYSMGTKPSLFISNVFQNGIATTDNFISFFSVFGLLFVHKTLVFFFLLKCLLSSLGSYLSALGLNFGKESEFEERCSKIISFSLISAFLPLFSLKTFNVKIELFEYAHAVIGAINGLCIAFVLSYNGAIAKIGISSVKDIVFISHSGELTSLNVASFVFQTGLAAWVSFTQKIPIQKEIDKQKETDKQKEMDNKETTDEIPTLTNPTP